MGLEYPQGLGRPCRNRDRRAVPGLGGGGGNEGGRRKELVAPKWGQSRHRGNKTRRARSTSRSYRPSLGQSKAVKP